MLHGNSVEKEGSSPRIRTRQPRDATTPDGRTFNQVAFYVQSPGAICGFDESMDNAFMNRIDNRTPIKEMYLASAWGNPGGRYRGVLQGGENTFAKMIKDGGG